MTDLMEKNRSWSYGLYENDSLHSQEKPQHGPYKKMISLKQKNSFLCFSDGFLAVQ